MNPTFSHFNTSFLTTSFITGLSLLGCSMDVFTFSSKRILWMQIEGPIPFKSSTDQAISALYFLRIFISFSSLSFVKFTAIITGLDFSALRRHTSNVWAILSKLTPQSLFLLLVPSLHNHLIFLHCLHLDRVLFLKIQNWNLEIQHQDLQYTGKSSYFHSLNSESYNHNSVQN